MYGWSGKRPHYFQDHLQPQMVNLILENRCIILNCENDYRKKRDGEVLGWVLLSWLFCFAARKFYELSLTHPAEPWSGSFRQFSAVFGKLNKTIVHAPIVEDFSLIYDRPLDTNTCYMKMQARTM